IISKSAPVVEIPREVNAAPAVKILNKIFVKKADVRGVYNMLAFAAPINNGIGFEDLKKFRSLTQNDVHQMYGQNASQTMIDSGATFRPLNARANVPLTSSEGSPDITLPGEYAGQTLGPGGGIGGGQGPGGGAGPGGRPGGQGPG